MKEMMKIFKFLAFTIIIQTGVAIALPIHHHLDSFADIEILYRKAQFDTVRYNYRELDQNQLENFRSDSVFNYRINTKKGTTLWERILIWLTDFIQKLFYASGRSSAGKFIIYSLIAGALIFSVLKLINIRHSSLISKPLSKNLSFKIASENIHEIPFESQIEDAIENKNYKLAIRLYYLFALKKLTDSGSIEWAPGKSNHDYYYELKRKAAKEHFSSLSQLFEYAWYGGFKIEKSLSDNSRKYFKLLLSDLKI